MYAPVALFEVNKGDLERVGEARTLPSLSIHDHCPSVRGFYHIQHIALYSSGELVALAHHRP